MLNRLYFILGELPCALPKAHRHFEMQPHSILSVLVNLLHDLKMSNRTNVTLIKFSKAKNSSDGFSDKFGGKNMRQGRRKTGFIGALSKNAGESISK